MAKRKAPTGRGLRSSAQKKKAAGRAKKPLAFSGGKGRQSKAEQEKVLKTGAIRKRPKDQPLPGMENVRDRILSNEAGAISDIRQGVSDLKASEAGHLQTAHRRMKQIGVMAFTAHGVEFARVPGEEVLRVRTKKDRALNTGDDDDTVDPPDTTAMDGEGEGGGGGGEAADLDGGGAGDELTE